MPVYKFTSPTGENFSVSVPNGTTEAQARAIFDQQLNIGALSNIGVGQSITGASKSAAQAISAVAKLGGVSLTDPVKVAQILKQNPATINVGSLTTSQVTGLLGQAIASVNQPSTAISLTKGVGQFGFSPQQLEQQGFLKAGTVAQFLGTNASADFTKILSSPTVWTGKSGISNLDSFLGNKNIQNITQQNLMNVGLSQLKTLGLVTGSESPQQLSALVQGATKFGGPAMDAWTKGLASPNIVGSITNLAKGAQYAVSLVGSITSLFGGSGSTKRTVTPASGTVNRSVVDYAIINFLGNNKIPPPRYGPVPRQK